MKSRKMICAGKFYPAEQSQCRQELAEMFESAQVKKAAGQITAAIVPHAGWVFSGQVAAQVFEAIKQNRENVDTFVIFGAVHSCMLTTAAISPDDYWDTPIGQVKVDTELAKDLCDSCDGVRMDISAHKFEHSIEVNVPFIKAKFPQASILPILIPHTCNVVQIADQIGSVLKSCEDKQIVCIGSTDLTHYGEDFGFAPKGSGQEGLQWAKEVNDKALLRSILDMDAEQCLQKAVECLSACGPGAIAATVALAKLLAAAKAELTAHTHSSEIMSRRFRQISGSSVGYAGVIFIK